MHCCDDGLIWVKRLLDLEIDGDADPAVLGDIALLGRNKTPALDGSECGIVELLTPAGFLNLDFTRFTAGQYMHPQQHGAFPATAHGQ